MTKIEIPKTGRSVEIPSSWNEMTPEQIQYVFMFYTDAQEKGISPLEFSIKVLYYLLDLRFDTGDAVFVKAHGDRIMLFEENIYNLCDHCLGFLFADGDAAQLGFDSVVNPLPSVRIGWHKLIGPADLLQNLSFGEFRQASAALDSFFRSKDTSDLDECLAFLYRRHSFKENKAGRKVRDVTNTSFATDKALAGRMKPWQKNLALMWFSNCLKHLQSGVVTVDGEDINMSLLFSGNESSGQGPTFGWNDLLVETAKQQAVCTIEEVDKQSLFTILALMWHNYKENKRYEENLKTNKAR